MTEKLARLFVLTRWLAAGDVLVGGMRVVERKGDKIVILRPEDGAQFAGEIEEGLAFVELDFRDQPQQPKKD